ncbi:DUF3806 domain-containing protein [Actinotalea fermentans]|uniref:DUF3806 domain-containing protein n=1 Tax=Actinotalea fermentans TaxID=43671 RepID=A0A511YX73_9CELL|nr:DUF3806 domain-containing protein [Actinotalea fermentans]KGM16781.1 hypothetical protein N867_15705 [Actinotalea fermentans ATCC 43279 = JCM 9966 = DSM 3133]GEN79803.1 hypothetical protein AFE02nite_15370 [Actinotalea fermentans]
MGIFRRRPGQPDEPAAQATPQFLDLSEGELAWLGELRASLPVGVGGDPAALGRFYDEALDAWQATPVTEREDPNRLVNAIGVGVGDLVCARVAGARWVVFVDDAGADLAVVAGTDNSTIFPTGAVGKRWSDGVRRWLPDFVEWAAGRLEAWAVEPSAEVRALAAFALEHAVRSVVPEGGPLVPFCMVESPDGRSLQRFVGELGESVARARDHARSSGAARAAVAWDGYLTVEGRRDDALFVEASDAGQGSIVLAQRYASDRSGTRAVGSVVDVGNGGPLL